jgi:GntR family carbon starvation induced transcriptional regulator
MSTKELELVPEEDALGDPLSQVAWQTLRSDIINGVLPPGTRLRVAKLRETYCIGASPLREALSRLVSDGFVLAWERRGFVVAPMSLAEFRDLTNIRKVLESEALRSSLENGGDDWEAEVLAAFHRLSKVHKRVAAKEPGALDEWETLNEALHEALVSACQSKYTLRFRRMVYAYAQRYRLMCLTITSVSRNSLEEHRKLAEASVKRNARLVCSLMDEHLEATYVKVEASGRLAQGGTPATSGDDPAMVKMKSRKSVRAEVLE